MKLQFLTPSRLRIILAITLLLILALGIGIFYISYGKLKKSAADTSAQVASARDSQNTLSNLQELKKELDAEKDAINRTAQVMANSQNYTYQDQIINDLTVYAGRAGLSISNIAFSANQAAPATGTAAPTTQGLKTVGVAVTLANPVDYTSLLNFLHYIEQNLTKLKLSSIDLTKSSNNDVTTNILSLEVYVK